MAVTTTTQYHSNQRRLRANKHIRELSAQVRLHHHDFIQPLFVDESLRQPRPVAALSGVQAETITSVLKSIESNLQQGVSKFLLFPVPAHKCTHDFDFSFVTETMRFIKERFGQDVWIAADLCLCAYTAHGHCGILNDEGNRLLNHESVTVLADYAYHLAQAGADCMAPSDMMDGRIGVIRETLNRNGFDDIAIMSYAAKFQSSFYGPFREACHSSPDKTLQLKDRKTYQLSSASPKDALATALRDAQEGADIIMVKPAVLYADILQQLKTQVLQPLAAYHVSGEYQSVELLAQQGLIDRAQAHLEVWTTLKRAGADIIISYAAAEARQWIEKMHW
jgi:porphobilinogen synthase